MKKNMSYSWMNWNFYWILFLTIVPFHINRLNAQDVPQINKRLYISFYYDATGNRTDRQMIIAMNATKPSDSLNDNMRPDNSTYLSASNEKATEENNLFSENKNNDVYEDRIGNISLRLYPNPVYGSFNVIAQNSGTSTQQDQLKFFLYTTTGYLLQSGTIAFNESKLINMNEYIAGTYLFLVENKECRETWKIIKR
ncbi:MAG: T9SS type A sorting domain-containing protein [Bacteroides sp.]|nr:T9SS type A sorting domain-containing protein [Ruminococcus flavefaciens]MCM1554771.1 T9SS type A sorting domain-containing protein [Bacteroides sp.]